MTHLAAYSQWIHGTGAWGSPRRRTKERLLPRCDLWTVSFGCNCGKRPAHWTTSDSRQSWQRAHRTARAGLTTLLTEPATNRGFIHLSRDRAVGNDEVLVILLLRDYLSVTERWTQKQALIKSPCHQWDPRVPVGLLLSFRFHLIHEIALTVGWSHSWTDYQS